MQLENKHLAAYVSHDIMVGQPRLGKIEAYRLYGLKKHHTYDEWMAFIDDSRHGDYQCSYIKGVKPILYPLSSLTKPITHKGETFVPLIELFQKVDGGVYSESNVLIKKEANYYLISTSTAELRYYQKDKYFKYVKLGLEGEDFYPEFNQLELFEKFAEWMIDYNDLIPNNLAIDVNTLEINPYL